jgi:biopolymer transport protein ExbD
MSHGSIEKCEPNMTPMLDLVLQLVMFFMLCANFIAEDVNATIKLPTALQARPLDKAEDRVIFLNVDKTGYVLPTGRGNTVALRNRVMVAQHMKRMKEIDDNIKEQAVKRGKPEPKSSLVVLRAHEDCKFEQIQQVLLGCQEAGYTAIQFRAIVGASK